MSPAAASPCVDEAQVAEVFVRINSEGVKLNQADFMLTLMSVWRDKGRRQLEDFSRAAKQPSAKGPSPFNHFIEPAPDQLLRVAVGLAFRRAREVVKPLIATGRAWLRTYGTDLEALPVAVGQLLREYPAGDAMGQVRTHVLARVRFLEETFPGV
jgi:hypothetical protein